MIYSMTGFARTDTDTGLATLGWELRAVNHRYLETSFRLPDGLRDLEGPAREIARKKLKRGKLECTLRYQLADTADSQSVNQPLAAWLIEQAGLLGEQLGNPAPVSPLEILRWPGVVQTGDTDFDTLKQQALNAFEQTLEQLIAARAREGQELKQLIEARLDAMCEQVEKVRTLVPAIIARQQEKLRNRISEAAQEINTDRLEQELVYLGQRLDVDEEIDRLTTHIDEVRRVLKKGGACGRRLDFLMQELNREANTLGSKSISADSTQVSVELKVLIEQMREQIQNIE